MEEPDGGKNNQQLRYDVGQSEHWTVCAEKHPGPGRIERELNEEKDQSHAATVPGVLKAKNSPHSQRHQHIEHRPHRGENPVWGIEGRLANPGIPGSQIWIGRYLSNRRRSNDCNDGYHRKPSVTDRLDRSLNCMAALSLKRNQPHRRRCG
jgi:hypothetical protein